MLRLEGVTKSFGGKKAVDGVSLVVPTGQLVGVIGRSGAGKSTLLRMINRLGDPTSGRILFGDTDVTALRGRPLRAWRARCAMIFQQFNLAGRLDVLTNVMMGRAFHMPPARALLKLWSDEEKAQALSALESLDMARMAGQRAETLSGGQQQRVALARALAIEPSILLLDEPFAALDRNLRLDMQIEIKRLQRTLGLTTILVTHDQDEAMSVADRIAVMHKGKVEQFDTPVAIYDQPQTLFVNGFIGTTNLMNGKVASLQNGTATVALDAGASLTLPAPAGVGIGAPVLMSVRPEQLSLSATPGPDAWKIEPGLALPIGAQLVHEARAADGTFLKIIEPRRAVLGETARTYCTLAADARPTLFPRST